MSLNEGSALVRAANSIGRVLRRSQLLVLCYHGIDDPRRFGEQMQVLGRRRRPVSLDDVVAAATSGRALPPGSVLVTFDDGDRTVLEDGLPVLRDLHVPAALFVISGLLGGDEPFWWDEVDHLARNGGTSTVAPGADRTLVRALKEIPDTERRAAIAELRRTSSSPAPRRRQLDRADLLELEAGGIAIGSHTVDHPCLDRCDPAVVERELVDSRVALEELLGHPVVAFAYPNGNVSPAVRRLVSDAGYSVAFGFDHRLSASPVPDPLLISRVRVDSTTEISRFEMLISGVHPALHHLRGRP